MSVHLRSILCLCTVCLAAFAVFLCFSPANLSAQFITPQDYYSAHHGKINDTQNKRLYELNKLNQAKQIARLEKFYRSLYRRQSEIFSESNGFFGNNRDWNSGVFTVPGKLADVSKGNVTIITDRGPLREKLANFSQEDQDHIKHFQSWEKAGTQKREKWFKDYYDCLKREKLAEEQEANAKDALEKQKQMELSNFQKSQNAFAKIMPGETTQSELTRILGKPSRGDGSECFWLFKNPETGKRLEIKVIVQSSKVVRAVEVRN